MKWTMRNGDKIPVREMTDKHLYHTVCMLERRVAEYQQAKELLPVHAFGEKTQLKEEIKRTKKWIDILQTERGRRRTEGVEIGERPQFEMTDEGWVVVRQIEDEKILLTFASLSDDTLRDLSGWVRYQIREDEEQGRTSPGERVTVFKALEKVRLDRYLDKSKELNWPCDTRGNPVGPALLKGDQIAALRQRQIRQLEEEWRKRSQLVEAITGITPQERARSYIAKRTEERAQPQKRRRAPEEPARPRSRFAELDFDDEDS